jgi:sec-independent protein translocase protein TatB
MFDIGWSELALIAVVALIAIGPKELPGVLRTVGQWMGKARRMASEFQGQFQEAMREAEMADLKQSFDEVREAAKGLGGGNLMTSVTSALGVDTAGNPLKSSADTPAASVADTQVIPTTPEAPTAETFAEAETHVATTEPLAITPEVHAASAPAIAEPAAPEAPGEIPRDAKAS